MTMAKIQTSTQILETSQQLFNEHSVENVSIAQIAKQLGISTGNLTYHFAKKKEIVGQHIRLLEERMVSLLQAFPYGGSAREFLDAYGKLFKLTWDYRYLFTGTTYLLQNELLSKAEYQRLVERVYGMLLQQTDDMIEAGLMKKIPAPHTTRTLIDCIWWQWLGWLDNNQILPSAEQQPLEALLENSTQHLLFLVQPYMGGRFIKQLYRELDYQPETLAS